MDYLISGDAYLERHKGFKLVGRQAKLRELSSVLMRSRASSIILVGQGGVGCTAICLGLQASKSEPNVPFDIVSKRLFWLDTDSLFSSGDQAQINKAFQQVMAALNVTNDSVLIIEDTRDFIEAARNSGMVHFMNALTLAVRNNKTQIIFECRDDDLDMVLKCHSDMRESYTIIDVQEPIGDECMAILRGMSDALSAHHKIRIDDGAVETAQELTNKYRIRDFGLSRAQPERAATLLDRAMASYRLDAHGQPDPDMQKEFKRLHNRQKEAEQMLITLDAKLAEARKADSHKNGGQTTSAFIEAMGVESENVQELVAQRSMAQKEADENKKQFDVISDGVNSKLLLTRDLVLAEFSRISGISVNKLNQNERDKLKNLENGIKATIFGQDNAVTRVSNAIKVARVGRRNREEPQASFLFLGPSGVGKTEFVRSLATYFETNLARFDMSEYMEKHAVAKLIGAPPGYEGFEVGGILTNTMRKNPNQILLFDEIEKAHPDVFNVFLQVLSAGRLTDSVGRVSQFSDSMIFMTTNIGQAHFLRTDISFEDARELALAELASVYRSEFLNRFAGRQNIVCFDRLGLDSIEKIVRREINKVSAAYEGIEIHTTDSVISSFCRDHYDSTIGARGLPGYIQANLDPILANMVLDEPGIRGTLLIGYNHDKKTFETAMEAERNAA